MTLRLARLALREITLPLAEPFRTAGGVVDARRVVLAELTDAEGRSAWSECVAESRPTYSADTVDTCWLALTEWIAPVVLGAPWRDAAALHHAMESRVRGHLMARATVEMGAWALQSLAEGRPLARTIALAAGSSTRATVATGVALGMFASPDALAERAVAARREGYARIKLKVSPGHDVAYVRAVREALGPEAVITADANCSYMLDDATHVAALLQLDDAGLSMLEQPLAADDLTRHAELQGRMRTRLCLDESIRGAADVEAMIALGSARVVNLKPGRVGGLSSSIAIYQRCVNAGVPLWCGGMLETGIGRAYNVALASLSGFTEAGDLSPSARYWTRDVVTPAWTMDAQGQVRVPLDVPGIGVMVDVGFIDDLTVRCVVLHGP